MITLLEFLKLNKEDKNKILKNISIIVFKSKKYNDAYSIYKTKEVKFEDNILTCINYFCITCNNSSFNIYYDTDSIFQRTFNSINIDYYDNYTLITKDDDFKKCFPEIYENLLEYFKKSYKYFKSL